MSGLDALYVCPSCGWRCTSENCALPPEDHECMRCGADGPTFWNGEPADCRRVLVVIADAPEFPLYWARALIGSVRHAVEVSNANQAGKQPFYLDNEDGSGWAKVRHGHGSPRWGHRGLAISKVLT